MNVIRLLTILVVSAAASPCLAAENATPEKSLKATLDELLPGMGAERGFESPQQQWQELCFQLGAPGNEARRTEACKLMAAKLAEPLPARAKIWLLKQLERIGHEECVDAVAKLIDDSDPLVRDAACRALANNPSSKATSVLGPKLASTSNTELAVALLDALQFRADRVSVCHAVPNRAISGQDSAVAAAGARVFGRGTTPPGLLPWLNETRLKAKGEVRFRLDDAYLACADRLLKDGKVQEAAAMYKDLNAAQEPRSIRMAALKGSLNAAGDRAASIVLDALAGNDADARAVALGHVGTIPSAGIKALGDGLAKLPAAGQIALVQALGARRDTAALPGVVALVASGDENVKAAALRALGGVADASAVSLLVDTAMAGGPAAGAARESLEATFAEGVDAKLIERLKDAKDLGQRGALIEILDRRAAAAAVPALLDEARHENADLRRRAIGALGRLAGPGDVAGMIKALAKITDRGERDEAERAITLVCSRIPDEAQQAEPVLAVYAAAGEDEKSALLPVLGRIGVPKTLDIIRSGLTSGDAARYENAARAICSWPDSAVAEDLLALGGSAKTPDQRVQAVRAFARVIAVRDEQLNDRKVALEKLALVKRAMSLASRDEERRLLLERAANLRHVETLRFAASFLDNPGLAQQACRTVVDLAHLRDLREPDKAEFEKALDRVIAISKDNGLIERARDYRAGK
ncbi:MAG: HEAT repeat domain-containing protein [Pirellulales bacterium]